MMKNSENIEMFFETEDFTEKRVHKERFDRRKALGFRPGHIGSKICLACGHVCSENELFCPQCRRDRDRRK
jgi:rubrerythrin